MTVRFQIFLLIAIVVLSVRPASAQEFISEKHDTRLPIEVLADQLEVMQKEEQAVFSGNVIASQGNIRLTADRMVVHYRKGGAGAEGAISRIDVYGNVFLSTGQETASGQQGFYDVDNGLVKLLGDVAVTRGQNILKGNTLEYDLNTGRSVVNAGATAATEEGQPAAKPGRVRGLFHPGSEEKLP